MQVHASYANYNRNHNNNPIHSNNPSDNQKNNKKINHNKNKSFNYMAPGDFWVFACGNCGKLWKLWKSGRGGGRIWNPPLRNVSIGYVGAFTERPRATNGRPSG